jgi:hypothetical protein
LKAGIISYVKKIIKSLLIIMPATLLAGILFVSCSRDKSLSPEEALRSIKALDSDLNNLVTSAEEQKPIQGLKYLMSEPSSPLNTTYGIPAFVVRDSFPGLDHWYGNYTWNTDSLKFIHSKGEENIRIAFSLDSAGKNDMSMVISRIGCHPFFSKPCFPDVFEALMKSGEDEILRISYSAEFQDQWPSEVRLELEGDRFHGNASITRSRKEDLGDIHAEFLFKVRSKEIFKGKIDYEVGYFEDQMFIRTVTPEFSLFDVDVSGKLDYTKVDPTSKDYINSFNNNCNIILTEHSNGKMIGKFGLGTDESGELLEWAVRMSDGSTASLYDYIILFRKIMDYKYPNNP